MTGIGDAASIIAVIQIATQVFNLCQTYFSEVRGARSEIKRLRDEVMSLHDILVDVKDLDDPVRSHILHTLNQADAPVMQCELELASLFSS